MAPKRSTRGPRAAEKPPKDPSPPASEESEEVADDDSPPTDINPYTTLAVDSSADSDAIKKAYRKAALLHHPDKAAPEDKAAATQKFQEVAFAYAVLSDSRRRARYDATGSTAETLVAEDGEDGDFDWTSFYRDAFAEAVTEDKIAQFAEQYRGSDDERDDILKAYTKYKGNLDAVFESVMLSSVADDEDRFREVIDAAIASKDVESYKAYTDEPASKKLARKKRAEKEAKEAAKEMKKRESKGTKKKAKEDDLAALIQSRQSQREAGAADFFAGLEEKYAGGGSGKGKRGRGKTDEPPEEAFERNRKTRRT